MEHEKDPRRNPSTAPKGGETDNLDREEGSYAPGVSEYGPDHPRAPETDGDEAEEEEEADD